MKLKFSNKKIIEVRDWDNLVSETYGKIYSFQQQDGCKERGKWNFNLPNEYCTDDFENTEIPFEVNGEEMGVSFKTWLKTDPKDTEKHFNPEYKWENNLFWERNFYPSVDMIIEDLYEKGIIEDGEYSIDIDW